MPIYEYLCPHCNCKFELMRPVSRSDEDATCTECQHPAKRTFSRFASFSKGIDGNIAPLAGSGSSCSGCSATTCGSCNM